MNYLEIIELRTGNKDRGQVAQFIEDWLGKIKATDQQQIRVYHNALLDTDISVHLFHQSVAESIGFSQIGSELVFVLKEFGLVNHNIWIEQKRELV